MSRGFRVNELRVDADTAFATLHTPFHDVAYTEIATYPADIDRSTLVRESRVAPDNKGSGDARQIRRQAFRDAVGEIVLLPVVREIDERHHDNRETGDGGSRRSVSRRRRGRSVYCLRTDRIDTGRPGPVL